MTSTVAGTAINAHDCVGCGSSGGTALVTGQAINAHDNSSCAFALGLFPDANITQWQNTDLVFTVWTNKGELTLDDATIEFVIRSDGGQTIATKLTDDYSIITFGSNLVVHLTPSDGLDNVSMHYTATITTGDDTEYTMSGLLNFLDGPMTGYTDHIVAVIERDQVI